MTDETIAAISTAYGEAGIGIIRISGEQAGFLLDQLFRPASEGPVPTDCARQLRYGTIIDPAIDQAVDEVLAVFMPAPATYTREDTAEIYCHGGLIPQRKILELVCRAGARPAEAGEFTRRAFMNGRIDLSQAEAVIDLIKAKTDESFSMAYDQMAGRLFQKVQTVREQLMHVLVHLAASLDFSDEDIEFISPTEIDCVLAEVIDQLEQLLATAHTGRILREGLKVAIAGRPNVGKSSLLNTLLRENRAIVTDIPGTTRDTIEEILDLGGLPICLIDTAGIRDTGDKIEKLGIEKSQAAFRGADLILFMVDGSQGLEPADLSIAWEIAAKAVIGLVNKTDLDQKIDLSKINQILPTVEFLSVSLKENRGVDLLETAIRDFIYGGAVRTSVHPMVSNQRHISLIEQAVEAARQARLELANKQTPDMIEVDIRECWSKLGEITGETVHEDIIDEVFARFCLGK
ncbi:MAG TPA: tRNA uridine-5-carboxymethylaminomethyl(34) synthesis GTPase MnmE [Clostridiales bacterium]|nr:tRNA uridine-5-carboxymethylaminomethyl(34) synthesis GTPase MnmE [Clostridiales bacterium]